jgi:hypothetical protein
MAKPITPDEVVARKTEILPSEVFDVFNDLIATNWNGVMAIVQQGDAVSAIEGKLGISSKEVFERNLLEIDECYRAAGWEVTYDKPAFNESHYPPTFTFRRVRSTG